MSRDKKREKREIERVVNFNRSIKGLAKIAEDEPIQLSDNILKMFQMSDRSASEENLSAQERLAHMETEEFGDDVKEQTEE